MNKNKSSTALGSFPRTFWIANSLIIYGRVVRYLDGKKAPKIPLEAELVSELS